MNALPPETIERILICCGPQDVSNYSRTCKYAHKLVYRAKDQFLWRELFLGHPFDDLRKTTIIPKGRPEYTLLPLRYANAHSGHPHWRSELQKRFSAEMIAHSTTRNAYLLEAAYETFLSAIATAAPMDHSALASATSLVSNHDASTSQAESSKDELMSRSENIRWLDRVLRKTRMLDILPAYAEAIANKSSGKQVEAKGTGIQVPSTSSPEQAPRSSFNIHRCEVRLPPDYVSGVVRMVPPQFQRADQMRARLRASVALLFEDSPDDDHVSRWRLMRFRKASRAYVYALRRYKQSTLWGPYRVVDDGHTLVVNWEHIEHILNIVALRLREIPVSTIGRYNKRLFEMNALRAYSAVSSFELPEGDWAGVTGTWRRFACSISNGDLRIHNHGDGDPNFFCETFCETLRSVELQLSLITKEQYYSEPHRIAMDPLTKASLRNITADIDDPAFPTLYFKGDSDEGSLAQNVTIRGKVAIMSDGAIRWQFATTYDGMIQWTAEAVQVSHVCSAAGIAGIWKMAPRVYPYEPVGPFWMTRVTDDLPVGILHFGR